MHILVIDNYDSFTYNLVQILEEAGTSQITVVKNDKVKQKHLVQSERILFSPGPGLPHEARIMSHILENYSAHKSILGICLGLQAIATFYGAKLEQMPEIVHGIRKKIRITDKKCRLFKNIPAHFEVGLYHSWFVSQNHLPACLRVTAVSKDNTIMAVSHKEFDIQGLQFHPESYMTDFGTAILKNWLVDPEEQHDENH